MFIGKLNRIYRVYIVATACGAAAAVAALALFALGMSAAHLPAEWSYGFALSAMAIGCLTAGFVCGRVTRRGGLKNGALCGLILFLLCLVGGIFVGSLSLGGVVSKLAVTVFAGAVGGVLGVNRE